MITSALAKGFAVSGRDRPDQDPVDVLMQDLLELLPSLRVGFEVLDLRV